MKTAMQELINYLRSLSFSKCHIDELEEKYIQKEKEQIIDFANCFYDDCITEGGSLKQSAEEYYNQTYNQNIDLKQVAEKLRDRKELFPEANQRVKDMLNKQNK
jgi:hypothetical protein